MSNSTAKISQVLHTITSLIHLVRSALVCVLQIAHIRLKILYRFDIFCVSLLVGRNWCERNLNSARSRCTRNSSISFSSVAITPMHDSANDTQKKNEPLTGTVIYCSSRLNAYRTKPITTLAIHSHY